MELLSSRMGSGDPMAADKGFEAWSLLTPEEEDRRSAGEDVIFFAVAAEATGGFCAVSVFADDLAGAEGAAAAVGSALLLAATCLTAGFLSAAAGLPLPGAATA